MTPVEITKLIFADLDSRDLKNPEIRKSALKKIWEYMKEADEFLVNGSIVLPSDKAIFKSRLAQIKGYVLNSAESSVINMIYFYAGSTSSVSDIPVRNTPKTPIISSVADQVASPEVVSEGIEVDLVKGNFFGVDELDGGSRIPESPGLYCIKIRKGVSLPKEFGIIREDGIIYIGQASVSLRERLWEEELNHRKAATFFRSMGAVLGFLPPKGSLVNKKNKKNYRFSEADTQKIIEWMRRSLLVNFLVVNPAQLNRVEKDMIKKYRPLVNIKHNPAPSVALKVARKRCVEWANEKP